MSEDWRQYLPTGTVTQLANKFGVTQPFISMVLSGKKRRDDILDEALRIAEKEKKKRDALEMRKAKLTS